MNFGMRVRGGLLATLIMFALPVAGLLAAMLVSSPAAAQGVSSIVVEGNRRVEVETIRSYFKPGQGERFDSFKIDQGVKALYATAFEVETTWLVEAASRRQKWIDQAQSLNIYMAGASGKKLDETYKLAWLRGLKTTYYLRTLGATHAEKSTVKAGALNAVPADGGILQ